VLGDRAFLAVGPDDDVDGPRDDDEEVVGQVARPVEVVAGCHHAAGAERLQYRHLASVEERERLRVLSHQAEATRRERRRFTAMVARRCGACRSGSHVPWTGGARAARHTRRRRRAGNVRRSRTTTSAAPGPRLRATQHLALGRALRAGAPDLRTPGRPRR
jgi:hypothetical protein